MLLRQDRGQDRRGRPEEREGRGRRPGDPRARREGRRWCSAPASSRWTPRPGDKRALVVVNVSLATVKGALATAGTWRVPATPEHGGASAPACAGGRPALDGPGGADRALVGTRGAPAGAPERSPAPQVVARLWTAPEGPTTLWSGREGRRRRRWSPGLGGPGGADRAGRDARASPHAQVVARLWTAPEGPTTLGSGRAGPRAAQVGAIPGACGRVSARMRRWSPGSGRPRRGRPRFGRDATALRRRWSPASGPEGPTALWSGRARPRPHRSDSTPLPGRSPAPPRAPRTPRTPRTPRRPPPRSGGAPWKRTEEATRWPPPPTRSGFGLMGYGIGGCLWNWDAEPRPSPEQAACQGEPARRSRRSSLRQNDLRTPSGAGRRARPRRPVRRAPSHAAGTLRRPPGTRGAGLPVRWAPPAPGDPGGRETKCRRAVPGAGCSATSPATGGRPLRRRAASSLSRVLMVYAPLLLREALRALEAGGRTPCGAPPPRPGPSWGRARRPGLLTWAQRLLLIGPPAASSGT